MPFEVRPAGVEELAAGEPREVALENARRKALAVPGDLVLGADTDVALDGEVLGKPRDAGHARELLARVPLRELVDVRGRHLEGDAHLLQDRPPLGRSAG